MLKNTWYWTDSTENVNWWACDCQGLILQWYQVAWQHGFCQKTPFTYNLADTRCWPNVDWRPAQRLRRWANVVSTLGKRLVSARQLHINTHTNNSHLLIILIIPDYSTEKVQRIQKEIFTICTISMRGHLYTPPPPSYISLKCVVPWARPTIGIRNKSILPLYCTKMHHLFF